MLNPNRIAISELLFSHAGTRIKIETALPTLNDSEVTFLPDQTIEFEGLKIEDGICLYPLSTVLNIKFTCTRCLKEVNSKLDLRPLEKQYYVVPPEDLEEDLFALIDKRNFEINIVPLIEEIVYLSIPTILICGQDCHGAPSMNQDELVEPNRQSPFANLKNML